MLAWLNADDQYQPDTVETAIRYFEAHPDAQWLYGSAQSITEDGQPFQYRNYRDDWDYDTLLKVGSFVNQPSVFLRRQVIEEFGYLDESLHFGMDYEYWLRIGRKYPAHYVATVKVQIIRASTTKTESGGVVRLREIDRIARRYGASATPSGTRSEWGWVFAEAVLAASTTPAISGGVKGKDATVELRHQSEIERNILANADGIDESTPH